MNFLVILTPSLHIFSLLALMIDYKNGPNPSFLSPHSLQYHLWESPISKLSPPPEPGLPLGLVEVDTLAHVPAWSRISGGAVFSSSRSSPSATWASWDEPTRPRECRRQAQLSCWDPPRGPAANLELTLDTWGNPTPSAQWAEGLAGSNEMIAVLSHLTAEVVCVP